MQVRFVVAVPGLPMYVPSPHVATGVHDNALVAVLKLVPAVHAVQVRSFDGEPATLMYWPMAQVRNAVQAPPTVALKVPLAQFEQMLFVVGVPAVASVVPAGQEEKGVQLSALSVDEYVPLAQSPQVRSVFVVLCVRMYLPAEQVVAATQGVAAVPSSSQVPATQATGALVPPLQEVPAAQAVQPGGVLAVPGVVS